MPESSDKTYGILNLNSHFSEPEYQKFNYQLKFLNVFFMIKLLVLYHMYEKWTGTADSV
jgi:hypothetical protein